MLWDPSKSSEEVASTLQNRDIAACTFVNNSGAIQSIYGFAVRSDDDGKLVNITGSLYDRKAAPLDVLGVIAAAALLGFGTYLSKVEDLPSGCPHGEVLNADHLVDTSFAGMANIVLRSFNLTCYHNFGQTVPDGMVSSSETIETFANRGGHEADWINSISLSINQAADLNLVWSRIQGDELRYIHPSYTKAKWPDSAPHVELSLMSRGSVPQDQFDTVAAIIGVASSLGASLSTSSTGPTPIIIQKDDADEKASQTQLLGKFSALFLRARINFDSCTASEVELPVFSEEFTSSVLEQKSDKSRAEKLKSQLTELFEMGETSPFITNKVLATVAVYANLNYVSLPMAKAIASCRAETHLADSSTTETSNFDSYCFVSQSSDSSLVTSARKKDETERAESDYGQHSNHRSSVSTSVPKIGVISSPTDAITNAANLVGFPLLAEDMPKVVGKESAFFQIFLHCFEFLTKPTVRSWLMLKATPNPSIIWQILRWIEQMFTSLAKNSASAMITSAAAKGSAHGAALFNINTALESLKDMKTSINKCIRNNDDLSEVPPTCPESANPQAQAQKKMRLECLKEVESQITKQGSTQASRRKQGNDARKNWDGQSQTNNSTPAPGTSANSSATTSNSNDQNGGTSFGGRGQGRGGQGRGRGRGRGRGGGRGGGLTAAVRREPTSLGCFFAGPNFSGALLPTNTSVQYCPDWMFMGKSCGCARGACPGRHYKYDSIPVPADKDKIANHIAATEGLWFNRASVHSLTEESHKQQLGSSSGPGTN